MPLPVWTNAQVIAQLDSGVHLGGTSWTYRFPTTNAIAPVGLNTVITLASSQTVTLLNVDADLLTADHFAFV